MRFWKANLIKEMRKMEKKTKMFEVDVQEASYGAVRVQAVSKADAIEKAQEALAEGEVMWG